MNSDLHEGIEVPTPQLKDLGVFNKLRISPRKASKVLHLNARGISESILCVPEEDSYSTQDRLLFLKAVVFHAEYRACPTCTKHFEQKFYIQDGQILKGIPTLANTLGVRTIGEYSPEERLRFLAENDYPVLCTELPAITEVLTERMATMDYMPWNTTDTFLSLCSNPYTWVCFDRDPGVTSHVLAPLDMSLDPTVEVQQEKP